MNVLVIVAGVIDPRWPLVVDADGTIRAPAGAAHVLGPFDASALEIALALRDGGPETRIDVVVCGGPALDPVARAVAAYRPHRLVRLDCAPAAAWDAHGIAAALMSMIDAPGAAPDVVLLGRELGDCDDGALPPFLAEAWGWPFVGMVQRIERDGDRLVLRRERGPVDEAVHLPVPVLASVTNDKSNRLRHPLLKNVMAAKRVPIEVLQVRSGEDDAPAIALVDAKPVARDRRGDAPCRVLPDASGASIAELAQFLQPWRAER